jgi:hypothetical protein
MWKSIISTGQQATRATRSQLSKPALSRTAPAATKAPFSTTPSSKKEEVPDRETLNPEHSETTKSGTDGEVAKHPSAFDPSNTSPETEYQASEQESREAGKHDPLNMSPANQDVSAWRGPTEGGPDRNRQRDASSSRGTPKKNRSVHVKKDGTHVSYKD